MKACIFTLGCKMNEVESASLQAGLEEIGFETTDALSRADIYLLNTCAVTKEAEKKSRQAVARMRKFNPEAPVIVFGCAAEKDAESFLKKEGVTLVAGAQNKAELLKLVKERGIYRSRESDFCELPFPKMTRTRAFLRIQDGCNRFCSYCVIPYLRGRTRSREAESVIKEARQSPAREIVLTGIDISSYRSGDTELGDLLLKLKDLKKRIRLGSLEPSLITRSFLSKAREAGVMPHFHLSLQSGSTAVLSAMNRRYTREEYLEKCAMIYRAFPTAAITTDIIVGYPTETEEDFLLSLSIIGEAGFARVHAFPFSPREGTRAARLKELPPEVKKERMERILRESARAEEEYLKKFIGREAEVLYEENGGYTENYIRVYAEGREGKLYKALLKKREKDGLYAEIEEEL